MLKAFVALAPVCLFLMGLVGRDSFKLVAGPTLGRALVAGAAAALAALALHRWLLDVLALEPATVGLVVAPVSEELLKALLLVAVVRPFRIGFLVDAAILGYATGTGFALVENLEYLRAMKDAPTSVWVVRGLGAAILHGAATAIVAIVGKSAADRRPGRLPLGVLAGLPAAMAIHAAFNHAIVSPLAATALLLVVLPVAVRWVFVRSERATREWISAGIDLDAELLRLLLCKEFDTTRPGRYLAHLRDRFPGPDVADMYCLLRLQLELSLMAKGLLMAREAGLRPPPDKDLRALLAEAAHLEQSIGPTGLLALRPLRRDPRDRWQRVLLKRG